MNIKRIAIATFLLSLLAACGNKGPLVMPDAPAELPPVIKGYLRAGAWVCGEPAWDPDFNTADLPILMPMARLDGRYARHFAGKND